MTWFNELQQASIAGIPFGVMGGQTRVGRRNAIHEFPFRDEVWVEDLGRAARRIMLLGFLVENGSYLDAAARAGGAGSVIQQREKLIAALEAPGKSTLVHPTLGELQVSVLDTSINERWDRGRVFEIALTFIEAGQRIFPGEEADTGGVVDQTCTAADAAAEEDFLSAATISIPGGSAVTGIAAAAASAWGAIAVRLSGDATVLMNMVGSLPGSFGRFVGGALRDITGALPTDLASSVVTVGSSIAAGARARALVQSAVGALESSAGSLGIATAGNFVVCAQGVSTAVLGASIDPADSVRVLGSLATFAPTSFTPASGVGTSMATIQTACGSLFRRAAVVCVARASAMYQPASYDDAVALRTTVTDLLDTEIQVAGDSGEDASYAALRAVRVAVVQDLTARGADLARLTTITTALPMPALVLAQRFYRDSTRSDELVREADPVHPAFMPVQFKALAQ